MIKYTCPLALGLTVSRSQHNVEEGDPEPQVGLDGRQWRLKVRLMFEWLLYPLVRSAAIKLTRLRYAVKQNSRFDDRVKRTTLKLKLAPCDEPILIGEELSE